MTFPAWIRAIEFRREEHDTDGIRVPGDATIEGSRLVSLGPDRKLLQEFCREIGTTRFNLIMGEEDTVIAIASY